MTEENSIYVEGVEHVFGKDAIVSARYDEVFKSLNVELTANEIATNRCRELKELIEVATRVESYCMTSGEISLGFACYSSTNLSEEFISKLWEPEQENEVMNIYNVVKQEDDIGEMFKLLIAGAHKDWKKIQDYKSVILKYLFALTQITNAEPIEELMMALTEKKEIMISLGHDSINKQDTDKDLFSYKAFLDIVGIANAFILFNLRGDIVGYALILPGIWK